MTMPPGLRKLALAVHLSFSVGWIGAAAAYLGLGVAAAASGDARTVVAAWIGMKVVGWWVVVPLALGSLLTGLVLALGTAWGLFRHYWVVFSLALTVFAIAVLLLHMPGVSDLADVAREAAAGRVGRDGHLDARLGGGDLLHPGLGLVVLLVVLVLNVYKPRGLTPYGWRQERRRRGASGRSEEPQEALRR